MDSIYRPGTLLCANYKDFNGKLQPGVFLVIYDEALDAGVTDIDAIINRVSAFAMP